MSCPQVIKVITPGPPGPAGPAGPAGVGAAWQQGSGVPGADVGSDGDFYLNTANGDIYGPKAAGAWGAVIFNIAEGQEGPAGEPGPAGAAGVDGRTVLSGSGAPGAGIGANGDYFIDTTGWVIYGPKTAGAWPGGASLVGPTGPTGPTGPAGPAGTSLVIKGTVATVGDLSSIPSPAVGDAYTVDATGDVHTWSGTAWVNLGPIQGPAGPTGPQGPAGPAGAPGGSSGQLQWNNGGAFAGLSTSSIDGSGNLTFSARWIQSVNGAASAPSLALTGTWFTGGTATTTKPHFLIEPAETTSTAWSTNGTGLGVNAPSGFTGNLLDLQVNGTSQVRVVPSDFPVTIGSRGISCATSASNGFSLLMGGLNLSTSSPIYFRQLPNNVTTIYTSLFCPGSGLLEQRNGTNAQTYRLYNTWTSATNFERLNVRWTANEAIIDTEAGSGGGTLRGLKIGSASTSLLSFYGATPVNQPDAVADATDASTVITQLNALLARIRELGLIAT